MFTVDPSLPNSFVSRTPVLRMRGYPIASPVLRTPLMRGVVKSSRQEQVPLVIRRRQISRALIQEVSDQAFEYDILDKKWDRESWKSAIKNPVEVVDGFWVKDIEGEIPKEMHGTYFKNIPAGIVSHGVHVAHPFDAQGYIGSVAIKDGKAFFRSRFVKTKDDLREERAERRLFRGVFGTGPKEGVNPLFKFKAKNAGNTNVALHQGKLYPLYEGYPSCELDPFTLETLYPTLPKNLIESFFRFVYKIITFLFWTLGKLSNAITGSKGSLDFKTMKTSAHPHRDDSKNLNVMHSYGVNLSLNASDVGIKLVIYEFADNLKIIGQTALTFSNFCMFHDVAFTENYFIASNSPCRANIAAMTENKYGLVNCIEWDENGIQEIHLIPRPSSKKKDLKHHVIKIKDQPSFIFHFINAYEADGQFMIDAVRYPRLGPFKYTQEDGERYVDEHLAGPEPKPRVTRLVCDFEEVKEYRDLTSRAVELPSINPKKFGKPYRYSYMEVALHPEAYIEFQAIAKLDLETNELKLWTKDQSYFVGEHVFVPKPGGVEEDDGWIVGFDYDGTNRRTEFVILDAKHIEDGPIATLNLGLTLPHGLHGIWTDEFYGPKNEDPSELD